MSYNALKTHLADLLGISKDALHIHLGLAIFVALALLFRRRPIIALFGVLAFELVNETLDLQHNGLAPAELGAAARDIANTMFWPCMAWLFLRGAFSRGRAMP